MSDNKKISEADQNAEEVKMVEKNETAARGNVHSEESDEPAVEAPPPLPA